VGPLSPFGTTAGGDRAQISGTGFGSGSTVRFAGAPAAVEQVTSKKLVVVTPPGAEGFATIEVQNAAGPPVSLADVFRYIEPPVALSVTAVMGPTTGEPRAPVAGAEIEVTGSNFKSGIEVLVDGTAAPTTFLDASTVRATAPAHKGEGSVDVAVRNPEGISGTLPGALFYTQEFSLSAETVFDEARARHLYRRAAFGAPRAVIEQAASAGVSATVGALTGFTNDAAAEQAALETYGATPPPAPLLSSRVNKEWWIRLLLHDPNPFQERLAWFLHDHFATSERVFDDSFRWTMYFQIQLFRRFPLATTDTVANRAPGLGYDWKKLLVEVAKDRAMLQWLNGSGSFKGAPNENFARELWELFMLGEGNGYTETDIQEAARAFTGFFTYLPRDDPAEPYDIAYAGQLHDEGRKTILGATGSFGYDSISPFWLVSYPPVTTDPAVQTDPRDTDGGVVALTLRQRPVEASRHICRKLWEFFVYENPPDSIVDALANRLRLAGPSQWNLKPILKTILESEAMYSARAMKSEVKSPADYVIGFLRTTGISLHEDPSTEASRGLLALEYVGQVPLDPPDVSGWPTGTAWTGAQPMLDRTNFLGLATTLLLDDYATGITPLLPPGPPSPQALVDHLAETLDVDLSANARTRMIEYVNSQWVNGQQVPFAYDPGNEDHVTMKTRGLLWMIAQYHDSHAR
jgi:uncharacterized protein (DUF1800 family)